MKKRLFISAFSFMGALLAFSPVTLAENPLYTVTDGNVLDSDTYRGFIVHRNMCARCHGNFGQGMIGPNLAESLNTMTREDFENIVANGRLAMPPWKTNKQVMEGLDNLYAYYKARADGALGEVRPKEAK